MKNTYKVYSPDRFHAEVDLFKVSDSKNIQNYVFDTKEKSYCKALDVAKKAGYKII